MNTPSDDNCEKELFSAALELPAADRSAYLERECGGDFELRSRVEELPLQDVASALDRSLAWTKVSLMRSRQRLKRAMRDQSSSEYRSEQHD
jgi:hypothetical protein